MRLTKIEAGHYVLPAPNSHLEVVQHGDWWKVLRDGQPVAGSRCHSYAEARANAMKLVAAQRHNQEVPDA